MGYEVGFSGGEKLLAITDTASSKSVAGQSGLQRYVKVAKEAGVQGQFINSQDDFRFGASSRLFRATFTATILIQIENKSFLVRLSSNTSISRITISSQRTPATPLSRLTLVAMQV